MSYEKIVIKYFCLQNFNNLITKIGAINKKGKTKVKFTGSIERESHQGYLSA